VRGVSWTGRAGEGKTSEVVETFGSTEAVRSIRVPTSRAVRKNASPEPSLAGEWIEVELDRKPLDVD